MLKKHYRHTCRLSKLNYSQPNTFFVTICTYKHGCYFGKYPQLTQVVDNSIDSIKINFPNVEIICRVIMPNHVHLILEIKLLSVGASFMKPNSELLKSCRHMGTVKQSPTLGQIIRYLKAKSTFQIHRQININPI